MKSYYEEFYSVNIILSILTEKKNNLEHLVVALSNVDLKIYYSFEGSDRFVS